MEPSDEIVLEETVEVNETPGIVQSGGNANEGLFYASHIEMFRRVFDTGYIVDNDSFDPIDKETGNVGTSEPKQIFLQGPDVTVKKNMKMYLAPIEAYYNDAVNLTTGTIQKQRFNTYDEYVASMKKAKGASYWYWSNYDIVFVPNLFDKIIFDLLQYADKEKEANNLENLKAYISIISRLYALFIITVFQSQFIDEDRLRTTDPARILPEKKVWRSQFQAIKSRQFYRTNYDLFNALEILTALGFFGENSVLLSDALTAKLQLDLSGNLTAQQKASQNVTSWPADAPKNPQFPVLKSTPFPTKANPKPTEIVRPFITRTIWGGVLNLKNEKDKEKDIFAEFRKFTNNKEGKKNITYYMLEDVYFYLSTRLYSAFGINDIKDQDEIKTYKEFRNTREFLKAMPTIIDQAFRSQAVSAARGTVGDPILIADKFIETLFTYLQSGDTNALIQGDAAKKQTFDTLVGELNANKDALLNTANKQKLLDVGFDQTKFDAIKDTVTAGAGAAAATATLDNLQTVITTKEYYERIKKLAQEISTAAKQEPTLNTEYQEKVQAVTDLQGVIPQDQVAITAATEERDAALKKLNTARGMYDSNRDKIFNIIQAIDNKDTRFAEVPLSEYSKLDIFKRIATYQAPPQANINAEVTAIDTARDAIINIPDAGGLALPVIQPADRVDVGAANAFIDTYRGRFTGLRTNLINAYKTLQTRFAPTTDLNNPGFSKLLQDRINTIQQSAPLVAKLAADAFDDTPGVGGAAATPLTDAQKDDKITAVLTTLKNNVLELKRQLKPDTQPPNALVVGLPDTTPPGPLRDVPPIGVEVVQKPFIDQLISATTTGGSKRSTRRNRNRKNGNTRRTQ